MPRLVHIPRDQYKRLPWKNGLGFTDEIAIYPDSADFGQGDFLWRLSTATIEQDSNFSLFPEHDRLLVILSGSGIRLLHPPGSAHKPTPQVELLPLTSYAFSGASTTCCELIAGSVRDLNVFARCHAATASAIVKTLEFNGCEEWCPQGQWNFLIAVRGSLTVKRTGDDGKELRLDAGDTLRVDLENRLPRPLPLVAAAEAASFIAVSINASSTASTTTGHRL